MADNTVLNLGSGGDTIATEEISGVKYELVKPVFGDAGSATKVSATNPMPVTDADVETSAAAILAKLSSDPATQTTLAAILAKITSDPATQTTLAAILAKIIAAPATEAKQDTGNTSLGSIDTKLSSQATASKQDTGNTSLASIDTKLTNPLPVSASSLPLPTGASTETTVAAILAKIIAAPATEATLASILAKIIAAPATEAKQDTGNTSLASIKTNTDSLATPTTIFNGKTTVTTAGTRVALASSQAIKSVTIKALRTNTGSIYVGNSSVASTNGFELRAGESMSMDISNLSTVNLDCSVNGEGVTYLGVN